MTSVDLLAYAIPLLHAAKYPASEVCGVLLGNRTTEGIEIKTAVPYFHHWTTFTPMLEVALKQTEIYAKKEGWRIIGWYNGNQQIQDSTLRESVIKVADIIRRNTGQSIVFMIDNKGFSQVKQNKPAIIPYHFKDNQWRVVKDGFSGAIALTSKDVYSKVNDLLSSSAYHRIHDFDEHLEDITSDWLESSKFQAVNDSVKK
ncbi:hypothetical protein BDB01DRAFT_845902 [Pilobolus umbonatus]|nr:hypothetical protein BDB01DRAFT_845902 [Pilobolus umbonatus]